MPRSSEFDIRGARRGAGKGVARQRALAEPPCGQPFDPRALGHPLARAFSHGARQFERGGVIVLDIVAPRDPLAPFGARVAGEEGVGLGEQALGLGRAVGLDRLEDRGRGGGGHGAVIGRTRQNALGRGRLAGKALLARQRGEIFDPALGAHPHQLFGLRQIGSGVEP